MTYPAPQPGRRPRVVPFPILLPGCCGCGGVVVGALLIGGSLFGAFAPADHAPEAQAPAGVEQVQTQP
ncbi:hypothetical protein JSY14_07060 [Brachybacterium sp. EF45031]|uniref:hypothetical protein n=1 Tax=Brachybacterium sillae TaxID=2810536 RepID=UPI00217DC7D2|nr:hypothetical protein [Brachybacterium sillae]MCS6711794.1 hypothetical protein [Brachybacterium sillae]